MCLHVFSFGGVKAVGLPSVFGERVMEEEDFVVNDYEKSIKFVGGFSRFLMDLIFFSLKKIINFLLLVTFSIILAKWLKRPVQAHLPERWPM